MKMKKDIIFKLVVILIIIVIVFNIKCKKVK